MALYIYTPSGGVIVTSVTPVLLTEQFIMLAKAAFPAFFLTCKCLA